MKIIRELQKRSKLGEGRNFGIGFSILNKKNDKYETYLPFTACRDYLNDFSYVEYTKKEIGTIYGYNHKLLNCFHNKRIFHLGVNTLHYNHDGNWPDKDKAQALLIENYKNLEAFLNIYEKRVGLKGKTKISIDEDTLIIKAPIYWTKTTALISVYTLLIRCFFNITEEEVKLSIDDLFKSHKCFISGDTYMMQHCKQFYDRVKEVKFDKINYKDLKIVGAGSVHNFGIAGFLSKVKK